MDLLYLVHLSLQIWLHWDARTAQNLRLRKNAHNSDYFKNTCISRLYHQIDRLVQATSKNMQEKFELDKDLNVGQLNHFEQRSRSKDF